MIRLQNKKIGTKRFVFNFDTSSVIAAFRAGSEVTEKYSMTGCSALCFDLSYVLSQNVHIKISL